MPSNCTTTPPQYKTCTKCGVSYPATAEFFYHNGKTRDGLLPRCKKCHNHLVAENHKKNPDKLREYKRRSRQRNRDGIRLYQKKWKADNGESHLASERGRRAKRRGDNGTHTAEDIQEIYQEQEGKCRYCGIHVGADYHVDHIVPLSRGGTNGRENLAIACPTCNLSKYNRTPEEWQSSASRG